MIKKISDLKKSIKSIFVKKPDPSKRILEQEHRYIAHKTPVSATFKSKIPTGYLLEIEEKTVFLPSNLTGTFFNISYSRLSKKACGHRFDPVSQTLQLRTVAFYRRWPK